MTVKELRDKLATLPDDMPVLYEYDTFWSEGDDVRVLVVEPPYEGIPCGVLLYPRDGTSGSCGTILWEL